MAITTEALLVLAQNYSGNLVAQVNRKATTLSLLSHNADSGANVAWAARGSGAVAEAFTPGSVVSTYTQDAQAGATLDWAAYRATFGITALARAITQSTPTPEANIEAIALLMQSHFEAMADKMNKDIFVGQSGQTPRQIVGLDEAIGLTSNTYATIDRSSGSNVYWRPYVADPGSPTALSFAQIRGDIAEIMKKSGERPDIAIVGPSTYNAVAALTDPLKQFVIHVLPAETVSRRLPTYQGGAGILQFENCLFVEDKDATEGKIYYLNSRVVSMQYLPLTMPAPMNPGSPGEGYDIANLAAMNDGFNEIPLGLRLKALPVASDSDQAMMFLFPQLRVTRPNACGVRKNIALS